MASTPMEVGRGLARQCGGSTSAAKSRRFFCFCAGFGRFRRFFYLVWSSQTTDQTRDQGQIRPDASPTKDRSDETRGRTDKTKSDGGLDRSNRRPPFVCRSLYTPVLPAIVAVVIAVAVVAARVVVSAFAARAARCCCVSGRGPSFGGAHRETLMPSSDARLGAVRARGGRR